MVCCYDDKHRKRYVTGMGISTYKWVAAIEKFKNT